MRGSRDGRLLKVSFKFMVPRLCWFWKSVGFKLIFIVHGSRVGGFLFFQELFVELDCV